MEAGEDLVAAGWTGVTGVRLLLSEKEAELSARFSKRFMKRLKDISGLGFAAGWMDGEPAARATARQESGEGGILAALWHMSGDYQAGIRFELRKIPILQEVVEVCEYFGVNPYRLWSSDCLILAVANGHDMAAELESSGVPAAVIGKVTDKASCEIIHDGETGYLERPAPDEVTRVIKIKETCIIDR